MVSASTQVGQSKMDQYGLSAMVGWNRLKSTDLKRECGQQGVARFNIDPKVFLWEALVEPVIEFETPAVHSRYQLVYPQQAHSQGR